MKILVVGNGGREHALVWKLKQSERVEKIYVAPGNAGTADLAENIEIEATDIDRLIKFCKEEKIDLTVVGPEAPLVVGIVDAFEAEGLKVFGPNKAAAQLEGSKVFSKDFMKKYDIPTAKYESFADAKEAIDYIKKEGAPIVVKAEGLAAGKGVIVAQNVDEAVRAVEEIMVNEKFGEAGERIVVEEFLAGEEATVLAFTDGETIVPMIPSQDHKPAYDGDKGPNTGGMGAYAPAPIATEELMAKVYEEILVPTIEGLKKEGITFKGVLYSGLMIVDGEVKVIEYNVRFGDPEAEVVLPLLKNDLVDIIEAIIEDRLEDVGIEWLNQTSVCVIMASGGYPVAYEKGKEISGIKEAEAEDIIVFQAGTDFKDDKLVTAGGRVLGVTALGNGYQATIDRAYEGVKKIDFADAHYRTDIGAKAIK
ncbi:phosphoribosylamine--glycine ligase [Orenia metallireducens]|jgi:phosphoribosylamine--glycine ligase|uniref:Phosphoribosylamine--glycine ligase n=1 Tax=Orenia metallireducens TaxID=1413210 RepID=A0A285G201_9FIRM|nr:phosphoribosylamine--glycine ligase [Orenia metallireducens]PRX31812.1 phosphoribosylamine--glycine ligase [Orenia metallireducens]SNY17448.1 phosphoribosylamine--glycine ligase [Orenia metallireducens]